MDSKSILKSKTFWFNIALGLFALAEKTVTDLGINEGIIVSVLAIGNVILRTMTSQPVTIKPA